MENASLLFNDVWTGWTILSPFHMAFPDHAIMPGTFRKMISIPSSAMKTGAASGAGLARIENSLMTKIEPYSTRASLRYGWGMSEEMATNFYEPSRHMLDWSESTCRRIS